MAVHGVIIISSNDGNSDLATFNTMYMGSTYDMEIRQDGIVFEGLKSDGTQIPAKSWTYEGQGKFLGLSTTSGATAPDDGCSVGSTIKFEGLDDAYYYIVEGEAQPEKDNTKTTITYKGEVIASLSSGQTATLPCSGKKMVSDLEVIASQAADSPLPIEVATEDEMNALLETAEVGAVYKYTGTTGTYENGALYVVEEEVSQGYNVAINYTDILGGGAEELFADVNNSGFGNEMGLPYGESPLTLENVKTIKFATNNVNVYNNNTLWHDAIGGSDDIVFTDMGGGVTPRYQTDTITLTNDISVYFRGDL